MRSNSSSRRSLLFTLGLLVTAASVAQAGGPLLIFDPSTRTPYAYANPVSMYTDLGTLGGVSNAQANILVANTAASWTGVATSSFTASVTGTVALLGLGDITLANAGSVIGTDNTGNGITVIYDTNGAITTNFLGAPPGVLGIATPEYAIGGTITESWMVLNGASINAGDLPLGASYAGVVTHEMGHAINLAHTQTNGAIIFFGDDRGPDSCALPYPSSLTFAATETMFPFIDPSPGSTGVQQATIEHLDDRATLSDIYPAPGYPANFATIEGRIYRPDGILQITGVNVIARNVSDPFLDAQSALSGDFTQGALGADGFYRLTGLTPGANYVLYVDTIVQGGFSTTPVAVLPGPEEFWDSGETNNSVLDPPCSFTPVSVAAGQTATLDVQLNAAGLPPVIDVSPVAIAETLAPGQVTFVPVTISNLAGLGGLDLEWTLVDAAAAVTTPVFGTVGSSSARAAGLGDEPVVLDARDPRLARQCTQCGGSHESRVTPLEMNGLAKAVGVINDGSFELGPFGGAWVEASSNFGTPLCDAGTCGTGGLVGARTGSYWCWFGGFPAGTETGSVSQNVEFPVGGSVALEFWFDQGGCDSPSDFMEVRIDGAVVYSVNGAAANCADGVGYALRSIDVSAYADGGFHTVEFRSQTFALNAGATNFFVDDIALVQAVTECAWLSATPESGSIAAGGNAGVNVQIDATGLAPGLYSCELRISSNDPATPTVTVPVDIEVVDQVVIVAEISTGLAGPASVFANPTGTGDPLSAAQGWNGVIGGPTFVADATITVYLYSGIDGSPIVGFPANAIGVQSELGGWVQCNGSPLIADGPTDVNGITTISGALFAGGSSAPGELLQVVVNDPNLGIVIYPGGANGLEIFVNSADLTGDLNADLADVGLFSAFFTGAYGYPADFAWDGVVNLADLGRFAPSFGTTCLAPPLVSLDTEEIVPTEVVGVSFDVEGKSASRSLEPGTVADAFVLLRGSAASSGVLAWDLALRASDNVVIESKTAVGAVLDLGQGVNHVVGLGTPRQAAGDDALQLLHVRLRVTDDRAAYLWVEPSDRSALGLPSVASEGEVRTARPSSGDVTLPVASINDVDFAVGEITSPRRELTLAAVPNPFNPATEIRFSLPATGAVELRILDARGQLVRVLRSETMQAGDHTVVWNGTDRSGRVVGSGVYFASLQSAAGGLTQKLMLIK